MRGPQSTVIYNPRWMKGIVGIVASRLIETYRPTGGADDEQRIRDRIGAFGFPDSTFTRPSSRARTCWKTSADTCTPQG